ncbi:MAG: hypothetical protein PF487_05885 [Bacteroidales bacterium]|jgi:hypothetical protein|nr:hypothetical protein [Bacteroidales bacterium]
MKTRITNIIISTTTISRNGNGIFCSNFGRDMDSGNDLKYIVDF